STEEYEKELNNKEKEKCNEEIKKNEYSEAKHNRRKAIIKKKASSAPVKKNYHPIQCSPDARAAF
ncbi:MAG: hypothetical protein ACO3OJ_09830, partial [Paracoccaceae bacterium]